MRKHTEAQLKQLAKLISYSDTYDINIQFWPDQTAVFIEKDEVELQDYGGSFDHAIGSALAYLERIYKK